MTKSELIHLVRYGEIGLKGKNRGDFERKLVENIKVLHPKSTVVREHGQIVLKTEEPCKLNQVFGVVLYTKANKCKSELEAIRKCAVKLKHKNIKSFAVRATRSDKSLRFTSRDIEIFVGDVIRKKHGLKVDLKKPDKTIYVAAGKESAYVFDKKLKSPGGMPVGTSGRVLSLLSGGFDSIASSYLMAKRGAEVDYLHFHVFNDKTKVESSKIAKIVQGLRPYTRSSRLHLASYSPFQIKVLDLKSRQQKQELVVFRRLMVKVGEKLAQKYGYQALVLGDSLGQVASQTMENIVAVDKAVNIPIFRPLIGMDKREVINLVCDIGMEKMAIEEYKDCCSIVSRKAATRANLKTVQEIESFIKVDKIVNEIVDKIQLC